LSVFSSVDFDGHEEIVFFTDEASGLKGIIAIHSTRLGPALGGCRMYPYCNEAEAVTDVLRLARGMTYKAAMAGVELGGGKCVLIGDPRKEKTIPLLQAVGRQIEKLCGRYIVGTDIGTNTKDIAIIRQETASVSCLSETDGGYGDPAPFTALGVFHAIRAGVFVRSRSTGLDGLKVAVQGIGNVGYQLAKLLLGAGAKVIVSDAVQKNAERAVRLGASQISPDSIISADVDVFAPCAVGGILNRHTIPELKAEVIAGAANNQLLTFADADRLRQRGIIYVPDYVANGGGLMMCAAEWYRTDRSALRPAVESIYGTCIQLLSDAEGAGINSAAAADAAARQRLRARSPSTGLQTGARRSSRPPRRVSDTDAAVASAVIRDSHSAEFNPPAASE
jgi:leucine dehydrogenase